jgi:O-antigen ligase
VAGHDGVTEPTRFVKTAQRLVGGSRERFGFFFYLLLVYLFFEYGRPSRPMGIPMVISSLSLAGWLLRSEKRWNPQITGFVAFVVVMAIGIPLAANGYAAFWETYGMAVTLLTICVPLPSLVTSVRRIKLWSYAFLAVVLYVGGWAAFNGGYGPSAASGGQDENYIAAMMGMAIPFAYFSIFIEKRRIIKVLFVLSILVFLAAIIAGQNVSRGGFLGLCSVFLYCVLKSPRKWLGLGLGALMALVVLGFAGPAYWAEISTITDTSEGTADMRLEVWACGLRMFAAHPVLGVGPGNFRWVISDYESPEQYAKYGRDLGGSIIAHSLFIELLAEIGTAGAVIVGVLLWRTLRDLVRITRSGPGTSTAMDAGSSRELRSYANAVTASILACLVNGAFLSLLYYSYLWILIALGSAITAVYRDNAVTQRTA